MLESAAGFFVEKIIHYESIHRKKINAMAAYYFKYTDRRVCLWSRSSNPTCSLCSSMDIISCCCYNRLLDVERACGKKMGAEIFR